MRIPKLSLKTRFTLISAFLPLTTSFLFAGLIYTAVHQMESKLIGKILNSLTDWYIDLDHKIGHLEDAYPQGIQLYKLSSTNDLKNQAPNYVYKLDIGFHEVIKEDVKLHLNVKKIGEETYVMSFDQTEFESLEVQIYRIAFIALLLFSILGLWTGIVLANLAIKPVTDLANKVEGTDPFDFLEKLAPYYSDDVLGRLASSFDKQLEQIRYYLTQEKLFTGDVSHELRTPLTVITGAVDVLLANKDLSNKNRVVATRIKNASSEMITLINAFLILARVDKKRQGKEAIPVNQVVGDALEKVKFKLEDRGITVEFKEESFLKAYGSSDLLSVVLANILRNASSYTIAGSLEVIVGEGYVEIKDTGPGISNNIIDQVFSKRRRVDIAEVEGNGMGLAIVKRICDLSDWDLKLKTSEQGSSFTIYFNELH